MSAVTGNVAYYIGLCVLTPTVMAALIRVPALLRRLQPQRLYRREPAPAPVGPPIEKLARDLRRLHGQLQLVDSSSAGAARGRRHPALQAAYVDVLSQACAELEVAPPRRSRSGVASAAEVLRVEALLRQRGLDVRAAA